MDFKGQPVLSAREVGVLAVSPQINYVVGATPVVLTPPADAKSAGVLVLSADSGNFRLRLGTLHTSTFAGSDIDLTSEELSLPDHGYDDLSGPFILTTTGTLPTGLSLATNYWLIVVDEDTVKFATSLVHAEDGVAVNISGAGSGNNTMTGISATLLPAASSTGGGGGLLIAEGRQIALAVGNRDTYNVTVRGFGGTDTLMYYWL
jgi:hypothetical protein